MTKLRRFLAFSLLVVAFPLQAQMQFGVYAVVDGDELYVSEVGEAGPGAVYVYGRSGDAWVQTGILRAPPVAAHANPDDYFGRFVIRDGASLLVGSTAMDVDGDGASDGTVFVYRRDAGGWAFDSQLRPENVPMGVSYGRFAALAGDHLFITGLGDNGSRGAVWVFERDGSGGWTESQKLTPPDGTPQGFFFGWGLAARGDRLIVGSTNQGNAAFIYERSAAGTWELEATLEREEGQNGFASSVGWLGDRALVGVQFADEGAGSVLVYEHDAATAEWSSSLALTAWDRRPGAGFGSHIHTADDALWVGATGAEGSGRVYVFPYDADTGELGAPSKLEGLEQEVADAFGSFIATGPTQAVVGQEADDFQLGSAIVLGRTADGWMPEQKLLGPDPVGLDALTSGEIRCDDGEADRYGCSQVDVLSFLPIADIGGGRGARANDVWGWTDAQTGREYALVGRTDGTAFIDITDAESPVFLGDLPKTPGSRGNAWRDIKVYADHAFIVADGAGDHGMQVFDLTRLRDVRNAPVEFGPDALYEGIASAHNIVINEASGFAYAVGSNSGGETCGGGLHMIDIRQPTDPQFEGCFQDMETGYASTGYSHDAMCIDYDGPDDEHRGKEICFGSNENNLSIADVSDKENPVALSHANYPNVAYAHQGWITEDHRYFFMNDEGDESNSFGRAQQEGTEPDMPGTRTLVWDVTDLDDPVMVREHFGSTFTIDHNLYIKGDLMYQSNYVSGLRILDISDPENPEEVGFFDTVPDNEAINFDGSWSNYPYFASGTIVVSSGAEGVFFLKYRRPELVP